MTMARGIVFFFLLGSTLMPVPGRAYGRGNEETSLTEDYNDNDTLWENFSGLREPYVGNRIDRCWETAGDWWNDRKMLADCGLGFGAGAMGGKHGAIYVVTDSGDDNPAEPKKGTLRHAVIQSVPLWIVFAHDMTIVLKEELMMNSFKTIDGRGANVHIAGGACITVQYVRNIIIHGIFIHDCHSTGPALVRSSPTRVEHRGTTDGDGINIFGSSHIWIDHCYLARCADGLIDAIQGSTSLTYSNNYFTDHDKALLMGAHDQDWQDKHMQATVVLNYFGPGLVQRMPRGRHGYFHVVNNFYSEWGLYAVGGSANPTIYSEGNYYQASNGAESHKRVTKRMKTPNENSGDWNWCSVGDMFDNGAYFVPSGASSTSNAYALACSFTGVEPAHRVRLLTRRAGPFIT